MQQVFTGALQATCTLCALRGCRGSVCSVSHAWRESVPCAERRGGRTARRPHGAEIARHGDRTARRSARRGDRTALSVARGEIEGSATLAVYAAGWLACACCIARLLRGGTPCAHSACLYFVPRRVSPIGVATLSVSNAALQARCSHPHTGWRSACEGHVGGLNVARAIFKPRVT